MPGYFKRSLDLTVEHVSPSRPRLKCVLLFVQVDDALKDNAGTEALNAEGLMQRAVQAIKRAVPDMVVMTDVALDRFRRSATTGLWRKAKS